MLFDLDKRIKYLNFALTISESSSAGRARPCQGRGRGFEPRLSLDLKHRKVFLSFRDAWVVELVDTQDLKSCEQKRSYGFDSHPRYTIDINPLTKVSGFFVLFYLKFPLAFESKNTLN